MIPDRRPVLAMAFTTVLGSSLAVFAPSQAQSLGGVERVVAYSIVDARTIPDSLTGRDGDPEKGRQLYFDREQAGCSGCHGSPGGPGAQANAAGDAAPSLSGLSQRMDRGAARLWLVAPGVLRPDTAMPAYYAAGQRQDKNDPRFGEPRLSAQEIENLLAYLFRDLAE